MIALILYVLGAVLVWELSHCWPSVDRRCPVWVDAILWPIHGAIAVLANVWIFVSAVWISIRLYGGDE